MVKNRVDENRFVFHFESFNFQKYHRVEIKQIPLFLDRLTTAQNRNFSLNIHTNESFKTLTAQTFFFKLTSGKKSGWTHDNAET